MGKKKEKKKRAKEALKCLMNSSFVIGKLRDIFGMDEFDDKDVAKTFKRCIITFLENDDVDNDASAWNKIFSYDGYNENDVDDNVKNVRISEKDKSKVVGVSKNQRTIDEFSDLLG